MAGQAIFISYRRDDTMDVCGRIYDRLAAAFGTDAVFRDVDTMPFGEDFRNHIVKTLEQCRVVLILIGPSWLNLRERLEDPDDPVRLEIEEAIKTTSVQVIPVLVNSARMPLATELPEPLQVIARLNAPEVRRDPDFHRDMDSLIDALTRGQLSGFVKVESRSDPAQELWDKLKDSFDPGALRNFADTFPGIPESYQARERAHGIEEAIQSYDKLLELVRESVAEDEEQPTSKGVEERVRRYKATRDALRDNPPPDLPPWYAQYVIGQYSQMIDKIEGSRARVEMILRERGEREHQYERDRQEQRRKERANYVPLIMIAASLTALCFWGGFYVGALWLFGVPFFGFWTGMLCYLRSQQ